MSAPHLNDDDQLRWARAAAWARGQSLGPCVHGVEPEEASRIEACRDLIWKYDPNDELSVDEILDLAVADLAGDRPGRGAA